MDFEHQLMLARSEEEVFSIILAVSDEIGFPYCCYCIEMPIPFFKRNIIQYDNFPRSTQSQQLTRRSRSNAKAGDSQSAKPKPFRRSAYSDRAMMTSEAARPNGLRIAWTRVIYSRNGTFGVLSLARDAGRRGVNVSGRKYLTLDQLFLSTHTKFASILLKKFLPESMTKLSARELEVIRWVSEGKTSIEIAVIIGVSVPTVNFHIKNIIEKMYCVNRAHATAKAIALGFLS
jgi:LuxR family quorum-sensing system transcriptional regulator SolR